VGNEGRGIGICDGKEKRDIDRVGFEMGFFRVTCDSRYKGGERDSDACHTHSLLEPERR
jgi:hypothetical protein